MSVQLLLASGSPRRRDLLRAAGFDPVVIPSDLDDAEVVRGGVSPEEFVVALSWFKAARLRQHTLSTSCLILAADTVCIDGSELLGKPRDAEHARRMLVSLGGHRHRTVTGVSLLRSNGERRLFVDVAQVHLGVLGERDLDAYIASGEWQGKAGAYNYADRVAAGWALTCNGDPTSVMGLPMQRLVPLLMMQDVAHRSAVQR